jgi:hypothetical protein
VSVFSATARGDLVALSKEVQARERSIRAKAKRLVGGQKTVQQTQTKSEGQDDEDSPQKDYNRNTFGPPDDQSEAFDREDKVDHTELQ